MELTRQLTFPSIVDLIEFIRVNELKKYSIDGEVLTVYENDTERVYLNMDVVSKLDKLS